MSAALETSQLTAAILRPGAPSWILALASASVPGSRARIATSAPDLAYSSAIARPSPLLPPVTIALLPSSRTSTSSLLLRRGLSELLLHGQPIDFLHFLLCQDPADSASILFDLFRPGCAGDDARHGRPPRQPAQSQLQQSMAALRGEPVQPFDDCPVLVG